MQKKVEIVRLGAERAKEEMNAYRLINVKLMEEVNSQKEIVTQEKFRIQQENENAVKTSGLEPSSMLIQINSLKNEMKQVQKLQLQQEKDLTIQLKASRDLLAVVKEDYEMLEDKFNKQNKMYEEMLQSNKQEIYYLKDRQKELQDFHDRYDTIIQEERTASMNQIKEMNDIRDKAENTLNRKL